MVFYRNIWGVLGVFSARVWGNWGREVGGARFQPFGESPQAAWGFIRAHRFLPPSIPHLCLRLGVRHQKSRR